MRRDSLAWIGIGVLVLGAIVLMVRHSEGTVGGFSNSDFASIVYGVALLIVIGGSVIASRQFRLGTAVRQAVTWMGIALILITVYSFRYEFAVLGNRVFGELVPGMPMASTDASGRTVVTLRRDASGHFVARGSVNGASARFLVDTGATTLTLTPGTAQAAGIDMSGLSYTLPVQTANGQTMVAPVRIGRLEIGPLAFTGLRATVAPPGALSENLLGVNVLDRLDSYAVRGNEMVLTGG